MHVLAKRRLRQGGLLHRRGHALLQIGRHPCVVLVELAVGQLQELVERARPLQRDALHGERVDGVVEDGRARQ